MPYPGGGDSTTAGQGRRRRTFFKHTIEHCFWTARHGESAREDHDRSRGRLHADRSRARLADPDRLTLGFAIDVGERAGINTDSGADATGFTGNARSFTSGEQVVLFD